MRVREKSGISIIEMLTVLSICAVLLSASGRLFFDGWSASRNAVKHAENSQAVSLIIKQWQKELSKTDPDNWQVIDNVFYTGSSVISVKEQHLVFDRNSTARAIYLSSNADCIFSIERHDSLADCAVLTLKVESKYYRTIKINNIRIVACKDSIIESGG
jgi:hypothetical protein